MDKVSVLLASSYTGLSQSLLRLMENEDWILVVGTSSLALDVVDTTKNMAPDVVIIDYDLTDKFVEISQVLLNIDPELKIVVLSVLDRVRQMAIELLLEQKTSDSPAIKWISKNSRPAELLKAISASRQRQLH
ncbi:MAG TPA: response regulator transcription factor [Actinobacteria bacterium]|nr:response regulator transcription factor [Actinomycetota bacterium]